MDNRSRPAFRGPESDLSRKFGLKIQQSDGLTVSEEWITRYGFMVENPEFGVHKYVPTPKQLDFHESLKENCIIEGSRGTGKSVCIRNDAHMRALACPGYNYLIVRRTMPELKKTHLRFIGQEMRILGGTYHKTDAIAQYHNGSTGFFSHCETEDDMMKILGSEYCAVYFDEISTFTGEMITKIATCTRVPEGSDLMALVRGGTNPIGVGADYVRKAYLTKDIQPEDDPEYNPDDYEAIHTTLDDNPYIDKVQYIKRLSNLPEHIRRAWLDGEWVVEGMYFHDYYPTKHRPVGEGESEPYDWHVTTIYPRIKSSRTDIIGLEQHQWVQIYRTVDWGFSPDPAVCLWIAVLPNSRAFVMKEMHWRSKTAAHVAKIIKSESEGMHIVETYCDPTMFYGSEATGNMSVGDIFESNGVPLTPVKNDRIVAGYAIHEYLNTLCVDGLPKLQMYGPGCPMLVRTIPEMRTDKNDPRKIADGNDHWVISLAYFCMQRTGVSQETFEVQVPRWMRPKKQNIKRLGAESVR